MWVSEESLGSLLDLILLAGGVVFALMAILAASVEAYTHRQTEDSQPKPQADRR